MSEEREARTQRDRDAVARFLAGDETAFTVLVDAHKDNVHQFVRSLLGAAEAEDQAQEVFIQVFRSLRSFRGDSSFSTWLYCLARNVCRHRLRALGAAKRGPAGDIDLLELPDGEPSLLARLEAEETRALVRAAVNDLPPGHREVIVLSHWERLRYEEISAVLEIPVGTVKSRVHNAVAALTKALLPRLRQAEENAP